MTAEATNIVAFKEFMTLVAAKLPPSTTKPFLVLDNHSAHRSL